jgi:hypothetical protein
MKAAPDSFLHGCPRCDKMDHDFDSCPSLKKKQTDFALFAIKHRVGRCPLKQSQDPRTHPDFATPAVKMWTVSFTKANMNAWRTHQHLPRQEEEDLIQDPAMADPDSVAVEELVFQYPNNQPPSPIMAAAHPRHSFRPPRLTMQRDIPPRSQPQSNVSTTEAIMQAIFDQGRDQQQTLRLTLNVVSQTTQKQMADRNASDARHTEADRERTAGMLAIINDAVRMSGGDSSGVKRKRQGDDQQQNNSTSQHVDKKQAGSVNNKPAVISESADTLVMRNDIGSRYILFGKPSGSGSIIASGLKLESNPALSRQTQRSRPRKGRHLLRALRGSADILASGLQLESQGDVAMTGVQLYLPVERNGNINQFVSAAEWTTSSNDACRNCGSEDHKEENCTNMFCGFCGKINHRASNCKTRHRCKCKEFPFHESEDCKEPCLSTTCPKYGQPNHYGMTCTYRCVVCGEFNHNGVKCPEASCPCLVGFHLGQKHAVRGGGCMIVGCGAYYCIRHCEKCGLAGHMLGNCPYEVERPWAAIHRFPKKIEKNTGKHEAAHRRPQRLKCPTHGQQFIFGCAKGCTGCHEDRKREREAARNNSERLQVRAEIESVIDATGGYKLYAAQQEAQRRATEQDIRRISTAVDRLDIAEEEEL